MKILWFTNTPSMYDQGKHQYHGGGWIESLEQLISKDKEIELGISFFHPTDSCKVKQGLTTYFPIKRRNNRKHPVKSIFRNWSGRLKDTHVENKLKAIVKDFTPDVIHVFGTEGPFASIQDLTRIPVVIHLQGLINPTLNTYFPVNQSRLSFLLNPDWIKNNITGTSPAFRVKHFNNQAKREACILKRAKYIMGRTHWDKMIARLYNPNTQYFHVDEVLRPQFYQKQNLPKPLSKNKLSVISTLSSTSYKGIDVMLRVAKKMMELTDIPFQWQIIGLEKNDRLLRHFEKSGGIAHKDVNVQCLGRIGPERLVNLLTAADVFVHPSYVDNSPNSVCEAQMLGLPIIACDVGGLSTLVTHGENGFLVPSNGVFEIVHYLKKLANDKPLVADLGQKSTLIAKQRHNRDQIKQCLKEVYFLLSE